MKTLIAAALIALTVTPAFAISRKEAIAVAHKSADVAHITTVSHNEFEAFPGWMIGYESRDKSPKYIWIGEDGKVLDQGDEV